MDATTLRNRIESILETAMGDIDALRDSVDPELSDGTAVKKIMCRHGWNKMLRHLGRLVFDRDGNTVCTECGFIE